MGIGTNRLGNNGGREYDFLFQPVSIDCEFVVDNTQAAGISGLKGSGVQNVYMYSSSPSAANPLTSSSASAGVILVQLANNYYQFGGEYNAEISPLTGGALAINGSALTAGQPYVITAVGHGSAGRQTIICLADTAGSLTSTYFNIYDAYGNNFLIWFQVAGAGGPPVGVAGTPIPVSIASGAANTAVASALNTVLGAITANQGNPSNPAVASFSSSVLSATLTVDNVINQPFPGGAMDGSGSLATGFTFAVTRDQTNVQNWQAVGLPKGVVPAVNVSFVATATGYSTRGGSTGTVKVPSVTGISKIELIGRPTLSLGPIPMGGSPNIGGWIMLQCLAATSASVTTMVATQPSAGSIIRLNFKCESKSVVVSGE